MSEQPRFLFIEDSPDDLELALLHLAKSDIKPIYDRVDTQIRLNKALEQEWDLFVCDYNIPLMNVRDTIRQLKSEKPDVPCIILSGSVGEDVAVSIMRAGASDYIMKDNLNRLVPAIQRELKELKLRRERRQMEISLQNQEIELRQVQKLEAVGQLAGGVAHDFNNILATVFIHIDVLTDVLSKSMPQELMTAQVRQGLAEIKKSAERAAVLTRQLLTFSRKRALQLKILNLDTIISETEKMLRCVIEESVDFEIIRGPDLKKIKADAGQIEQILMNLIINARDAMPEGGKIKLETSNSLVDQSMVKTFDAEPGSYVQLTVSDSGTGMDEETQKHLFEPFFTTKPVGKGTGLGLSTVYGIVRKMNGLIFVESSLGKGTTFKIYFPATTEQEAPAIPISKGELNTKGTETILLVEDEINLRKAVASVLTSKGYNVLVAENGQKALELFKSYESKIHLIVTDVVMPQLGGIELAKQTLSLKKDLKFLFLSGYTEDTLAQSGLDPAAINFLSKPYQTDVFLSKIREILQK